MIIFTKEEFIERVKEKDWDFSVKEWKGFSLNLQNPEDVVLRALCGTKEGIALIKYTLGKDSTAPICYAYISESQYFDDDLVKELTVISSGLFRFDTFTEEYINILFDAIRYREFDLKSYPKKIRNKLYYVTKASDMAKTEKIDWRALIKNKNAHLSKQFLHDTRDLINRTTRSQYQITKGVNYGY